MLNKHHWGAGMLKWWECSSFHEVLVPCNVCMLAEFADGSCLAPMVFSWVHWLSSLHKCIVFILTLWHIHVCMWVEFVDGSCLAPRVFFWVCWFSSLLKCIVEKGHSVIREMPAYMYLALTCNTLLKTTMPMIYGGLSINVLFNNYYFLACGPDWNPVHALRKLILK